MIELVRQLAYLQLLGRPPRWLTARLAIAVAPGVTTEERRAAWLSLEQRDRHAS